LIADSALSQTSYFYQKRVYPEKKLTIFNNVIKTDLVSLASGDLALLYERRFNERFGLEGGAGFLLQPNAVSSFVVFAQQCDNFKSNSGFSLLVSPRLYSWPFSNNLNCILVRAKQYENLTVGEISYGFGYILSFSDKVFMETSFYVGLIQQWPSGNKPNYLYENNMDIPYKDPILQMKISVIIGFALN